MFFSSVFLTRDCTVRLHHSNPLCRGFKSSNLPSTGHKTWAEIYKIMRYFLPKYYMIYSILYQGILIYFLPKYVIFPDKVPTGMRYFLAGYELFSYKVWYIFLPRYIYENFPTKVLYIFPTKVWNIPKLRIYKYVWSKYCEHIKKYFMYTFTKILRTIVQYNCG